MFLAKVHLHCIGEERLHRLLSLILVSSLGHIRSTLDWRSWLFGLIDHLGALSRVTWCLLILSKSWEVCRIKLFKSALGA